MTSAYDRLKRRYITLQYVSVCIAIIMIVFICLFCFEREATRRSYAEAYTETITNAASLAKQCVESDYDYDTKYREIASELDVLCRLSAFMDYDAERQNILNRLYYAFIKLPNETRLYMPDISVGLSSLNNDDEVIVTDGFEKLAATINKFDLQDYGVTPE